MPQPPIMRVIAGVAGIIFVIVNVWRPWFGLSLLKGPLLWSTFCAGILLILAGLYSPQQPIAETNSDELDPPRSPS